MVDDAASSRDPESALRLRKLELEVAAAERENDLRARKLAAEAELAEATG